MGALRPHPALYNAINHMRITQAVTKAGDVTFYDFVEMISNQATLVNSQAPKNETRRKIDAAQIMVVMVVMVEVVVADKDMVVVAVEVVDLVTPTDLSFHGINGINILVMKSHRFST
jgi:hypothetical protein